MTVSRKWFVLALLLVTVSVTACGDVKKGWVGHVVKPERLMPLDEGGPHSGILDTKDLVLDYTYQRSQNSLNISGTVKFSDPWVTGFRMTFHFTDAQGTILEDQLVSMGRIDRLEPNPFQQDFILPPNTRSMAVSYEGRIGRRDTNPMSFWRNP